jgi:hypothetical protein
MKKKKHTRARDSPASRARLILVAPAASVASTAGPAAAPATPVAARASCPFPGDDGGGCGGDVAGR